MSEFAPRSDDDGDDDDDVSTDSRGGLAPHLSSLPL